MWPMTHQTPHLHDFLEFEPRSLSVRATSGFLSRASRSTLRIPKDLINEAQQHFESMKDSVLEVA